MAKVAPIHSSLFVNNGFSCPVFANGYSRTEESQADAHGVEILHRAGYDGRMLMVNGLTWLRQTEGDSGGGFFATHPSTDDRIVALQQLP